MGTNRVKSGWNQSRLWWIQHVNLWNFSFFVFVDVDPYYLLYRQQLGWCWHISEELWDTLCSEQKSEAASGWMCVRRGLSVNGMLAFSRCGTLWPEGWRMCLKDKFAGFFSCLKTAVRCVYEQRDKFFPPLKTLKCPFLMSSQCKWWGPTKPRIQLPELVSSQS